MSGFPQLSKQDRGQYIASCPTRQVILSPKNPHTWTSFDATREVNRLCQLSFKRNLFSASETAKPWTAPRPWKGQVIITAEKAIQYLQNRIDEAPTWTDTADTSAFHTRQKTLILAINIIGIHSTEPLTPEAQAHNQDTPRTIAQVHTPTYPDSETTFTDPMDTKDPQTYTSYGPDIRCIAIASPTGENAVLDMAKIKHLPQIYKDMFEDPNVAKHVFSNLDRLALKIAYGVEGHGFINIHQNIQEGMEITVDTSISRNPLMAIYKHITTQPCKAAYRERMYYKDTQLDPDNLESNHTLTWAMQVAVDILDITIIAAVCTFAHYTEYPQGRKFRQTSSPTIQAALTLASIEYTDWPQIIAYLLMDKHDMDFKIVSISQRQMSHPEIAPPHTWDNQNNHSTITAINETLSHMDTTDLWNPLIWRQTSTTQTDTEQTSQSEWSHSNTSSPELVTHNSESQDTNNLFTPLFQPFTTCQMEGHQDETHMEQAEELEDTRSELAEPHTPPNLDEQEDNEPHNIDITPPYTEHTEGVTPANRPIERIQQEERTELMDVTVNIPVLSTTTIQMLTSTTQETTEGTRTVISKNTHGETHTDTGTQQPKPDTTHVAKDLSKLWSQEDTSHINDTNNHPNVTDNIDKDPNTETHMSQDTPQGIISQHPVPPTEAETQTLTETEQVYTGTFMTADETTHVRQTQPNILPGETFGPFVKTHSFPTVTATYASLAHTSLIADPCYQEAFSRIITYYQRLTANTYPKTLSSSPIHQDRAIINTLSFDYALSGKYEQEQNISDHNGILLSEGGIPLTITERQVAYASIMVVIMREITRHAEHSIATEFVAFTPARYVMTRTGNTSLTVLQNTGLQIGAKTTDLPNAPYGTLDNWTITHTSVLNARLIASERRFKQAFLAMLWAHNTQASVTTRLVINQAIVNARRTSNNPQAQYLPHVQSVTDAPPTQRRVTYNSTSVQ